MDDPCLQADAHQGTEKVFLRAEAVLGFTEPTSSTIRVVALHHLCRASSLHFASTEATSVDLPTPAKAWRVMPPIAVADKPVDAVTNVRLMTSPLRILRRIKDLPVPAVQSKEHYICHSFMSYKSSRRGSLSIRRFAGM